MDGKPKTPIVTIVASVVYDSPPCSEPPCSPQHRLRIRHRAAAGGAWTARPAAAAGRSSQAGQRRNPSAGGGAAAAAGSRPSPAAALAGTAGGVAAGAAGAAAACDAAAAGSRLGSYRKLDVAVAAARVVGTAGTAADGRTDHPRTSGRSRKSTRCDAGDPQAVPLKSEATSLSVYFPSTNVRIHMITSIDF